MFAVAPGAPVRGRSGGARRDQWPHRALEAELREDLLELRRHASEIVGRALGLAGTVCRAVRDLCYRGDIPGDLARALRSLADVPAHLVRGRALLLDGAGDRAGDVADLADDAADRRDRDHGLLSVRLDGLDALSDVL